jgi:ureidoglycolate lyase
MNMVSGAQAVIRTSEGFPMLRLAISPLTKAAFAPFGEVVEADGALVKAINQGFATRCDGLAGVDVGAEGGAVNISLFVAQPRPLPIHVEIMERHPLGTQLFYPLQGRPWLVLVCTDPAEASTYRAFSASGRQGVSYARNVWHHPLLVLDPDSRFFIVDRGGAGHNLDEVWLDADQQFDLAV